MLNNVRADSKVGNIRLIHGFNYKPDASSNNPCAMLSYYYKFGHTTTQTSEELLKKCHKRFLDNTIGVYIVNLSIKPII